MRSGSNAPAATSATTAPGPAGHAPSALLPLRFMLAALLALIGAMATLLFRPELLATYHYNQHIIALTHLFVLGWILTIVMGATYQLVPVALETRLHSERLARWQFLCHFVGVVGMVATFWKWNMTALAHFGSLLGIGVLLYAYNMFRTLLKVPRWSVVATAVASTLAWLLLGVLAGLTITAGKCVYTDGADSSVMGLVAPILRGLRNVGAFAGRFDQIGAMHAHAHLGAVGVFVILIVGISYKLVPMFTLGELQSPRRANVSIWLLNAGLAGLFFTILLRSPLRIGAAALTCAGLVCYAFELIAMLKSRKRRSLDWGVSYFITALACLAPVSVLGLTLCWPGVPFTAFTGQLENLYGFLAFVGVVSFAIIGMLYKILPFLIWFRVYSPQVGRTKVPSLADLYSARLQMAGYWSYLGGVAVTAVGILAPASSLVRVGCLLLCVGIATLALNAVSMLSHLFWPVTGTLPRQSSNGLKAPIPSF